MTNATIEHALRQMPLLEAEAKELTKRLKDNEFEQSLLRPILKAAQQRHESPTEPASSGAALAPEPRKPRATLTQDRGKRDGNSLSHLLVENPEAGGIISAVVNGSQTSEEAQ